MSNESSNFLPRQAENVDVEREVLQLSAIKKASALSRTPSDLCVLVPTCARGSAQPITGVTQSPKTRHFLLKSADGSANLPIRDSFPFTQISPSESSATFVF